MSRFATLVTLNVNDALPDSWVDEVKAFHDYFIIPGADLASSATISITADWHGITGTTTIDNISDASGPSVGQVVTLWMKTGGPVTIRNNGGGTGNIRSISGSDLTFSLNETIQFVWDGTLWREYSQNRASINLPTGGQINFVDIAISRQSAGGNLLVGGSMWANGSVIVAASGSGTLYVGSALDTYMARTGIGQLVVQAKVIEALPNQVLSAVLPFTFNPDAGTGLTQKVGLNGGGAGTLTINAPAHPPSSVQTCLLVIHIVQASGGTVTISWNGAYLATGTTALPTSRASGTTTVCLFVWNGGNWLLLAVN